MPAAERAPVLPDSGAITGRVRAARRAPLFDAALLPSVNLDADAIEACLPHRGPSRLVDAVLGLDPGGRRACGRRFIAADDRGFVGHFPAHPVYPGVLLVESVGQLALFAGARGRDHTGVAPVRLTRVLEAAFLAEVRPGATLTLLCEAVDDDGMVLTSLGQALVGDTVVCVCAFEAIWIG